MLVDTGGIEPFSDDVILSQMRRQAQLAMEKADVIILVTDLRSGVTATDQEVASMLLKSQKPLVLCVNKCDRVGDPPPEFYEFYNLCLLYTSGICASLCPRMLLSSAHRHNLTCEEPDKMCIRDRPWGAPCSRKNVNESTGFADHGPKRGLLKPPAWPVAMIVQSACQIPM